MGKKEKLLSRIQQRPKNFTWDELTTLLKTIGYEPEYSLEKGIEQIFDLGL